jgi:hypothetical protein
VPVPGLHKALQSLGRAYSTLENPQQPKLEKKQQGAAECEPGHPEWNAAGFARNGYHDAATKQELLSLSARIGDRLSKCVSTSLIFLILHGYPVKLESLRSQ